MDYPGLDLTTLTDTELIKKLTELNSRIVFAYGMGNAMLMEQLQAIAETIQFEIQNRSELKNWEKNKDYKIIETDPGDEALKERARPEPTKISKAPSDIFIPKRSKRPTSE